MMLFISSRFAVLIALLLYVPSSISAITASVFSCGAKERASNFDLLIAISPDNILFAAFDYYLAACPYTGRVCLRRERRNEKDLRGGR